MDIIFNCIPAKIGGQLIRVEKFLEFISEKKDIKVTIYCTMKLLESVPILRKYDCIVICESKVGIFNILRRLYYENVVIPWTAGDNSIYLSFSHNLPLIRKSTIKYVLSLSNMLPFSKDAIQTLSRIKKIKNTFLKRYIIYSLKRCDKVIALSSYSFDYLRINIGLVNVQLIEIGVDNFWSSFDNNGRVISFPYLLYVSHGYAYKNHIKLVQGYARALELNSTMKLAFVGKFHNDAYYNELIRKIKFLGLENNVIFFGLADKYELRNLYQYCDGFIYPSLVETSPNILLEAKAVGCKMAVSNIRPMTDYCKEPDIIKFNPNRIDDIANTIKELIYSQQVKNRETPSWYDFNYNLISTLKCIHLD